MHAIVILTGCMLLACSGQTEWRKDYLERSVTVDGEVFRYRMLLPEKTSGNSKVPVMLYLHGSGARGDDNLAQIDGFHWAEEPIKENIDFIVVLPQCRGGSFWGSDKMARYAIAALDQTIVEFNGDPQRLYLAGFSLGGYGTWHIAAAYPGKFAAVVPVAGGIVGERPPAPEDRAVVIPKVAEIFDSPEPYVAAAKAIGQTPVWAFHGSDDDAVPVEFSRKSVQALKDAGNNRVRYTEYQGDKHQIFGKAIAEPGLLEWLSEQRLD